jgi:hypothetical protein
VGERSSTPGTKIGDKAASRQPETVARRSAPGKESCRQHRYPGVKRLDKSCTRHGQNVLNTRPASSSCPYSQPTYERPKIPVDFAGQCQRIHHFAAQRQRNAQELRANQHQALIEQHRSKTRPQDGRREVHGVIAREIQRMRAAKGIKPARILVLS